MLLCYLGSWISLTCIIAGLDEETSQLLNNFCLLKIVKGFSLIFSMVQFPDSCVSFPSSCLFSVFSRTLPYASYVVEHKLCMNRCCPVWIDSLLLKRLFWTTWLSLFLPLSPDLLLEAGQLHNTSWSSFYPHLFLSYTLCLQNISTTFWIYLILLPFCEDLHFTLRILPMWKCSVSRIKWEVTLWPLWNHLFLHYVSVVSGATLPYLESWVCIGIPLCL